MQSIFSKQNFLFRHQKFKKNSRLFKVSSVNTNLDDDDDDDDVGDEDDAAAAILSNRFFFLFFRSNFLGNYLKALKTFFP